MIFNLIYCRVEYSPIMSSVRACFSSWKNVAWEHLDLLYTHTLKKITFAHLPGISLS